MTNLVRTCFHAVGNGTSFSGQILNSKSSETFNWIYDCGSTSKKIILDKVNSLPVWFQDQRTIDMLVISHFDNDHVNGLEILLNKFYVKRLVLPFTEWPQSVREISILGKKGITPSVALFQLNPAKWLQVNGLDNRISEIVLVEGRNTPDYETSPPNKDSLNIPDVPQDYSPDEEAAVSVFFEFDTPLQRSGINIIKLNHFQPINDLSRSFEFMFYNAEKDFSELGLVYESGGKIFAKKSGQALSKVKDDIESTIVSLGLNQKINKLPSNWRKILKNCYEQHFGHTGKAKNNISLCMYAAPMGINSDKLNCATLLTGDINISCNVIDDMKMHFGVDRWKSFKLVQVPHHGSQHSWTTGNTAKFIPAIFIQCVTPTKNHPHSNVTADLVNFGARVYEANRKSAVVSFYRY
ncbi:hypothetical protein KPE71_07165 [Acinetobacter soli]|uniref:hypothetical protein n=1 Tax=Acinetobacter soli TaxID=487316 RepID=UPI001C0AD649|nr:hypothetical protein [Acinetobacter soli]MBU3120042.1 hypothetical protein [Acinetobacter soli]